MFRELLVYHHSSLEFRAKVLTLMISADKEMSECEQKILDNIANTVYADNTERAELLIDTVHEYHNKIITDNGLNFDDLVYIIQRETKKVSRFASKIEMKYLLQLQECTVNEDDKIFQDRIISFLQQIKDEQKKGNS